jgi:hypothetical protein
MFVQASSIGVLPMQPSTDTSRVLGHGWGESEELDAGQAVADAVYSPLVSCSCQDEMLHKHRRKRFQVGLLA